MLLSHSFLHVLHVVVKQGVIRVDVNVFIRVQNVMLNVNVRVALIKSHQGIWVIAIPLIVTV